MGCKIASTMTSNPENKFSTSTEPLKEQLCPSGTEAHVKQLPYSGPPKDQAYQAYRGRGTTQQIKK